MYPNLYQIFMHLNCEAKKVLTKAYIFLGPDPFSHGSTEPFSILPLIFDLVFIWE